MSADLVVAIVGAIALPLLIGAGSFAWRLSGRLASIETVISREMSHNGGSSTKDYALGGRNEAMAAKVQAAAAKHLAENLDLKVDQLASRQAGIERRLRQVSDVVVGMQAVQVFRDATAAGPPGSTTSSQSTTTTTTNTEGAPL